MTDFEMLDEPRSISEANDRAARHRRAAVEAAEALDQGGALIHALLAIEARLDELAWHVAGAR